MRSPKKIVLFVHIGILLALLLVACAPTTPAPEAEATTAPGEEATQPPEEEAPTEAPEAEEPVKEELFLSLGVDPQNIDPLAEGGGGGVEVNIQSNLFDTLLRRDDEMNIIPWVAESWEAIDDNTWEFKIREGIKFHNGEDLDANAVKYTWDVIMRDDPYVNRVLKGWYAPVESVEVVDQYTVRFITSEPYPVLIAYMTTRPHLVPPEYYEETWKLEGPDSFNSKPVGSGPYQFVEFVPDEQLTLEAFEDYWGGAPAIPRVTYRPIPEAGTRLAEFLTGGLDLITNVAPEHIPQIQAEGGVIQEAASVEVIFVSLRTDRIPEKEVRQALFYATNVQAIIENILGGRGVLMKYGSAVAPNEFGYDPSIEPYPYDPDRARELLAEAGWEDTDGNGFVDKDGEDLVLTFATTQGRYQQEEVVAEAIANYWEAVGVGVDLRVREWLEWREEYIGRTFDEDVWLEGTGTRTFDADSRMIHMIHSPATVEEDGFSAGIVSYYYNDEVDSKIEEARSIVDQAERAELYKEILTQLREDAYQMGLYQQVDIYAHSPCLQNFNARSDTIIWFGNLTWDCPE